MNFMELVLNWEKYFENRFQEFDIEWFLDARVELSSLGSETQTKIR